MSFDNSNDLHNTFAKIQIQNKKLSERFIDVDANYDYKEQFLSSLFPGHHKKINFTQFRIAQNLLLKTNYPLKSNKFIFDIETNNAYEKKIVQLAYYILDTDNNIIDKSSFFVFNDRVYTDYYKKIKYTTLKQYGVCPYRLFEKITHVLSQCEVMIGHNIKTFDCRVIVHYFNRFGLQLDITNKLFYDTLTESRYLLNLKNAKGHIKSPSLAELSQFFNIESDCELFHDALYDVHITYMCYVNLYNLNK